jgi:hypothetical protein
MQGACPVSGVVRFLGCAEATMNRFDWLSLLAGSAISLGLLEPGFGATAQDKGDVVELGGLKSQVPAGWVAEQPDEPQCYKQYRLEPVGDDKEGPRLTVEFLGKGRGSSAGEYVKRWVGSFFPPEGKKMDDVAKVRELRVRGAAVTYLDVRGDYKGSPGDPSTPRQDYRLLGVYFDTPRGPYVIRLFGPADTVEFYRAGFEDWVKGFQ